MHKVDVQQTCFKQLDAKINALQLKMQEFHDMALNETKNTAGDKHETALAMLQIEQRNTYGQLSEFLKQRTVLESLDAHKSNSIVVLGSLVQSTQGWYYVSVALGKVVIDNTVIFALSTESPLGAVLLGLSVHDVIEFNGKQHQVLDIL
jgi:transcription elongation GreA/GreB family factor